MRGLHTDYSEPTLAGSFAQSVCPDLEQCVECTNHHQSLQNPSGLWKPRAIDPALQGPLYLTLSTTYGFVISLTHVSQKTLLWSRLSWITLNFSFEIELPQHEICVKGDMVYSTELRLCGEVKAPWFKSSISINFHISISFCGQMWTRLWNLLFCIIWENTLQGKGSLFLQASKGKSAKQTLCVCSQANRKGLWHFPLHLPGEILSCLICLFRDLWERSWIHTEL